MYTVSVIMPVYNNEKTLRHSIETLLNQTLYDFELILINDGSTDASGHICNEYARLEPLFVEVVHQTRKGFGAARNKGLSLAKGKYIYFASAHDTFDKRLLQENVNRAEEEDADLVVFGFTAHYEKRSNEFEQHRPNMPHLLNQERFRKHYRNFHHFFPYALYNKLYRRSYLQKHRLKFFNVSHKEDAFFNLSVYRELESVAFNRISYFIRPAQYIFEDEDIFRADVFEVNIEIAKHLEALLTHWGLEEEFEDLILAAYFNAVYLETLNICSSSSPLSKEEKEEHMEKILQDQRLEPYLEDFKKIKEKNPYKLALLSVLQNRNGKATVQVVSKTKETKEKTSKFLEVVKRLFKVR